MNEQDYKEYQELINEGHSQRSAAKILGIDRCKIQRYIKKQLEGGVIMIDNEVVFEHIPQASCFGNNSISDYDLLKLAFEKLGHTLDIEYVSVDEYEGDEDE